MKKRLDSNKTLYFNCNFPKRLKKSAKRYRVTLGVGGNLGDSRRIFHKLLVTFLRSKFVDPVATAPIIKNPPFGFLDQPYFYNTVIVVYTNLLPHRFLRYILAVEKRFKRKRLFKDGPRSLDLDIIFFDKFIIESKDLTLPHPNWSERESVVIPLRYIYGIKNI